MTYYKIISENKFICVISESQFARFQLKHCIDVWCGIDDVQFVITDYGFFRDSWMLPVKNRPDIKQASIIEITEDEYNELKDVESYDIAPELETPSELLENDVIDLEKQITVDYVREKKILQMETATKNVIANGFDIDNLHYSLDTQDQLNLISLSNLVNAGVMRIPYHADGELCRYYTNDEMQTIISKAYEHITKYTTYFNSLKYWIETMNDIEEIKGVYFGVEIPDEFMSEVLKGEI